jgi:hypothetical protein
MGSSRVNIGNAAPSRKKAKKPKKMMRGGRVGMDTGKRNMSGRSTPGPVEPKGPRPVNMKDGGGLKDMSGDGKITQRDRIMAARGEEPVKRMRGGPAKKSGVMKRMRGGPVKK